MSGPLERIVALLERILERKPEAPPLDTRARLKDRKSVV